ncbi:hypothetical protein SH528x_003219 [Novipirellula sp. SH528]|uniref:hypothetical protein n=1 Tax=Novipirellula sp. SH528 TaxID=3454466 RepID=UPI003FA093D8
MWNTSAVTLAGATVVGLVVLSLVLAKSDTVDEFQNLFDIRIIRRASRSLGRFGLGSVMWLTTYIAVMIPLIQATSDSPVILVLIPLVTVMFLLARVAMLTLLDPGARRIQPPRQFPSFRDVDHRKNDEPATSEFSLVDDDQK